MRKIGKGYTIALIFILIGIFLCRDITYAGPNLRTPLLFNEEQEGTETFPKRIYLQNELTGENFELHRISTKGSKHKEYILYIDKKKIKDSEFIFSESSNLIYIHNIYVGNNGNYKHTSQGIGLTILRFIARSCLDKGKNMEISETDNYGLIRLCYEYLSIKTRYRIDDEELYFEQVDWLRDFGPIEISIIKENGFEWCGQFLLEQNTDVMKFIKVIPYSPPRLEKFAEEIVVTNKEGRVKVEWRDPDKIDLKIRFQVNVPVLVQGIKIHSRDLIVGPGNLILPQPGQELPSNKNTRIGS